MKLKILFLMILGGLLGCKKTDTLPQEKIIDLGGENWVKSDIDNFILNEFIKSYNIEVKYKWTPFEVNYNRTLVPPMEFQVEPALVAVRDIWMKPYEKIGGKDFLKNYSLSKFVLVGSAEYQSNGSIVLGTAEGGAKIIIYSVNDFFLENESSVKRMLHTIHHEFVHILHQTIHYPQAWRGLSTEWYTETWYNTPDVLAHGQGMVTNYAKASEKEDFAETVTFLLVHGQDAYNNIMESNSPVAHIFQTKQKIIEDYYKSAFNMDFKKLQAEVQNAIKKLTKRPQI
ncbi:substrate import-associated zinc metallohydrolase lipoprotein [Sphingobacterium sp.]|uniref:substrate import-associated zinc metallohydrolase lipoprotein n=1 Tax=Sphingobacterium sp. TaxID=341027 RepID=UPI0028A87CAB|nr:substrate import-associated zinc metallohydrolase lipoprotein [Sphingobacterium sp.]